MNTIILFGPAATGKSTIGVLLSERLRCPLLDADDVHPASNIAKMTRGEPLTDADRWPWLDVIRARIVEAASRGESLVVACSALKRSYRQRLDPEGDSVRWVYLKGTRALIEQRLLARPQHFMKASMLDSQLAALEEPAAGEALVVDIARTPTDIVDEIVAWLQTQGDNSEAIEPGSTDY